MIIVTTPATIEVKAASPMPELPAWLASAPLNHWVEAPSSSQAVFISSGEAASVLGDGGARTMVANADSPGYIGDAVDTGPGTKLTSKGQLWNPENPFWQGTTEPEHSRSTFGGLIHLYGDSGAAFRQDTCEFIWGATGGGAQCFNSDCIIHVRCLDDEPRMRVFRNSSGEAFHAVAVEDVYAKDEPGRASMFYNRNGTPAASHSYRAHQWVPQLGPNGALLKMSTEKPWNTDNGWLLDVHRWDYGDLEWKPKYTEPPFNSYASGTQYGTVALGRPDGLFTQQCQDSEHNSILALQSTLFGGTSLWKRDHLAKTIAPIPYTGHKTDVVSGKLGAYFTWPENNMGFSHGGVFETWTDGAEEYLLIRAKASTGFRWFVVDIKAQVEMNQKWFHAAQQPGLSVRVQAEPPLWTPVKSVAWEAIPTGPGVQYLQTQAVDPIVKGAAIGCVWDPNGKRFLLYQNEANILTITPSMQKNAEGMNVGCSLYVDSISVTGAPPNPISVIIYNRIGYSPALKTLFVTTNEAQGIFAVRLG